MADVQVIKENEDYTISEELAAFMLEDIQALGLSNPGLRYCPGIDLEHIAVSVKNRRVTARAKNKHVTTTESLTAFRQLQKTGTDRNDPDFYLTMRNPIDGDTSEIAYDMGRPLTEGEELYMGSEGITREKLRDRCNHVVFGTHTTHITPVDGGCLDWVLAQTRKDIELPVFLLYDMDKMQEAKCPAGLSANYLYTPRDGNSMLDCLVRIYACQEGRRKDKFSDAILSKVIANARERYGIE